jgi:hypothetical protein
MTETCFAPGANGGQLASRRAGQFEKLVDYEQNQRDAIDYSELSVQPLDMGMDSMR